MAREAAAKLLTLKDAAANAADASGNYSDFKRLSEAEKL